MTLPGRKAHQGPVSGRMWVGVRLGPGNDRPGWPEAVPAQRETLFRPAMAATPRGTPPPASAFSPTPPHTARAESKWREAPDVFGAPRVLPLGRRRLRHHQGRQRRRWCSRSTPPHTALFRQGGVGLERSNVVSARSGRNLPTGGSCDAARGANARAVVSAQLRPTPPRRSQGGDVALSLRRALAPPLVQWLRRERRGADSLEVQHYRRGLSPAHLRRTARHRPHCPGERW